MTSQPNRAPIVPYPTRVPINAKCKGITAGSFHSYAFSDQKTYFWGQKHTCYSLVTRSEENLFQKQQIYSNEELIVMNLPVEHISTGKSHTFAWNKRKVYCWGSNQYYELGFDEEKDYGISNMHILEKAIEKGYQLTDLSCGEHHTLAAFCLNNPEEKEHENSKIQQQTLQIYQNEEENQQNAQLQLFAWGQSSSYQLTINTVDIIPYPVLSPCTFKSLDRIYSKSDYNIALCNGMVYSWGCNLFSRLGQLTNSSQLAKVRIPREVNLPEKVTKIGIGTYHIIAVTESGSAYSWGKGNQGQLGVDKLELEGRPAKVSCEYYIKDACCGQSHTLVLLSDGRLMSCGSNAHGVLGHQGFDPSNKKKKVKKLQFVVPNQNIGQIIAISCGNNHNLVLNTKGEVYGWGDNQFYQILPKQKPLSNAFLKESNRLQQSKSLNNDENSYFVASNIQQSYKNVPQSQYHRLQDWKRRYNAFKQAKNRQEQLFMQQFQQIMQQIPMRRLQ